MAEALLKHFAGDKFEVNSAGSCPCGINPNVGKALSRIGVSVEGQFSKSVDEFTGQSFDYVITVCDNTKSTCPVFSGGHTEIHWPIKDPGETQGTQEEILSAFIRTRDILKERISDFIEVYK